MSSFLSFCPLKIECNLESMFPLQENALGGFEFELNEMLKLIVLYYYYLDENT